jgi:hypothetical protein
VRTVVGWGADERRAAASERGRRRWRWHAFWHDLPWMVVGGLVLWLVVTSADVPALPSPDVPWAAVAVVAGVVGLGWVWWRRARRYRRWR